MNRSNFTSTCLLSIPSLILALAVPAVVTAQVPVVEAGVSRSQPVQAQPQPSPSQQPVSAAGSSVMLEMYEQMEQLKQELSDLRGMVEQQSYQIRQMQNEQRDRYLDLDRRVSELTTASLTSATGQALALPQIAVEAPVSANPAAVPATVPQAVLPQAAPASGLANSAMTTPGMAVNTAADAGGSTIAVSGGLTVQNLPVAAAANAGTSAEQAGQLPADQLAATPGNEQEIYRTALNLLLEEGRYEDSIAGFDRYIEAYPSGRFVANAYYWQGEALILVRRYAQAERVLRQVVEGFPTDQKAADALLKLGVVYWDSGNRTRARETWQSIRNRYPGNLAAIRAADDYLNRP